MKRPRPYIPLSVRVTVAERQFRAMQTIMLPNGDRRILTAWIAEEARYDLLIWMGEGFKIRLAFLLKTLFGEGAKIALDHNPALILRKFNKRTGKYTPDANDPDHLVYRPVHDHHIKTNVRGDGAQRSDTSERMHRRRMDENRGLRPRKPKIKIRSGKTQWVKGRKLQSRGFP